MIIPLLRKLERYGPISNSEKDFLNHAVAGVTDYVPGQSIVDEASTSSESYLVIEGFAGRIKLLPEGTRQIMAFHIPGDFCDLHSFVLKKMDHGIQAMSRCKLAKVPHSKLARSRSASRG